MHSPILVSQSPREWFKEAVGEVLSVRHHPVSQEAEFYLVELLASRVAGERPPELADAPLDEPLALLLLRAMAAERRQRAAHLKRLGDTSLFVSGFFGDSLARSAVDAGYYRAMGERAYGALAEGERSAALAGLYAELSRRFEALVDCLAEVAELSELESNRGLLRLYERFLLTRSQRVAEKLRARGVALFAGPGPAPATGGTRH
ncbi:MAG: hypothetical protein IPO09_17290 [Anaeromyxobacter sp.]|nr:hypothetical protein [Anaeromyxobacter sp.]MBL0276545.1 hypothetical protein [Anaeromyxobacter sp.]